MGIHRQLEHSKTTYKGFNTDLTCRGFQYEIGQSYSTDGPVELCRNGYHSCEYPLDVFLYYSPADSRFCESLASGNTDQDPSGNTKIASANITIQAELQIPDLVTRAIDWIWSRVSPAETDHANSNWSAASNTGNCSAASNTGDWSAASNTGNWSAASNTGYRSAASNTGDCSAASNTGYRSAASVAGQHSVAIASGYQSKAKASEGSAIVICLRNEANDLIAIRSAIAGKDGIKPDVWYMLNGDAEFVEVDNG